MNRLKILRLIIIVLLVFDMAAIFLFSAQKAEQSSETSGGLIEQIVKIIYKDFEKWDEQAKQQKIDSFQHLVRKLAHMTEYASLGVLSCALALTYGFKIRNLLLSLCFCSLYSASDEVHQMFVPGRSCQFTDMLIDTSGALIGIALFALFTAFVVKLKKGSLKGKTENGF